MPIYKFVDSIQASPTVLLDLDNKSPLAVVEGTQTSPPPRRVSSSGSAARNGDVVSQKSYPDRQITIRLRFELKTTAEAQAEAIQKLGRLLDGPQWLLWQHDGKTAPVFYRTKFGDIDVDDFMLTSTPTRYLTLNITAEPFAYGLPVTGTATINNDPTHATNPMSYVFPAIQGDVATPMYLSATMTSTPAPVVASTAIPSGSWTGVQYDDSALWTQNPAVAGVTWSTLSTSLAIGGSAQSVTTTGVTSAAYLESAFLDVGDGLPGDYRMFVRVRGGATAKTWDLTFSDDSGTRLGAATFTSNDLLFQWVDMGVSRFPVKYPEWDSAFGLNIAPAPSVVTLRVGARSASALDIDGILFVPVGVDTASSSTYAEVTMGTNGVLILDAINDMAAERNGAAIARMIPFVSSLPSVAPGQQNVLHFIRSIWSQVPASGTAKTATTSITWSYYPRYLYDRPATT